MLQSLKTEEKVIGTKQVKRAISKDEVSLVFIAKDADIKLKSEIENLCKEKKVPIEYVEKMKELGEACGIDINAATAALLNKN
jgi:large subunit ribosomal protein L7A